MVDLEEFISSFSKYFPLFKKTEPWKITNDADDILREMLLNLNNDYRIENNIAIHKTAVIETGVTLKGTVIISENCFVGAHAYIRGPVFLSKLVKIGPGSEIKQSLIFDNTAVAHFNYIGNSIIGSNVNFEAGSVSANHFNEREVKNIFVNYMGQVIDTQTEKFGSLVGDNSKIGANAVLSPGTILPKNSIIKRLELVEQAKMH